ncbi:CDP-alcohol phosphatidyltransferase family protein [Brachybacterium huguangmaarense]|uniref:CDP-alcohol phosphatidyltransferase family protein n=1 Tax=Brachybacterium huguangmaarense TaxID=1652028 RepID=A0ABY6G172_9MICO|nr:CDP-alcohol phosphatidyltransferase family protein [Brachybacterium huguangmaarense]UYG16830.1 CDP-alcohol phosphatidyltransferase family protein [Brachybacterium huguangmaarense]
MSRARGERPDWATLPNAVTLVRFVLLLPICVMLVRHGPQTLSVVLLLVWALTDWVDGMLARALGQTSRTGQIIDPIADRLGLVGIVLSLALAGLLPWSALVFIFVVDLVVTILSSRSALQGSLGVSRIGKVRTALLMTSVFLLACAGAWAPSLVPGVLVLLWIGVALHVVAGAGYVVSARARRGGVEEAAGGPAWRR